MAGITIGRVGLFQREEEENLSRKTISLVVIIGGVVLMVLSLGADLIFIGSYPGFNWAQLTGVAVGLAALVYGYWLGRAKVKGKK